MNHQPFNSWLYEDAPLNPAQAEELKLHMQTCPDCTRQYEAWLNVRHMLKTAEVSRPQPGFSNRWLASLEARRLRQQRRQVRITILALAASVLIVLAGLITYFSLTSSLADLFASVIGASTQVAVGFVQIGEFFESLLRFLPPALTTAIWFIIASWICILCLAWVLSVWRISRKGAPSHEELQ